jgi:hypothetical protein
MRYGLQPSFGVAHFGMAILLTLLSCSGFAWADSLNVADSVITKDNIPLWSDSALALSDSVPRDAGFKERWLIPFSLLLVSGAVAVGLYTIRSK